MSRLRIAHVVATFPPYLAGTGHVAYHNALELARRGHDVDVFTATNVPVNGWRDPLEIRVQRLPALLRVGNAPLTPGLLARLRAYDLVHLHWPYIFGSELTWLAASLNRQPYVLTYHIDLIGRGIRAPLFRTYQSIWAPRLIARARAVYAVSLDHFASTAGARYAARAGTTVTEVSNGVDLTVFAPGDRAGARLSLGLPGEAPLVLFVAALDQAHYYKGLGFLLEALPEVPGVNLVVVGDGDLRSGYEADAATSGIADRVNFVGAVGHDRLATFYRAADATVLPSTHTESFGLVLAESLACGTPAIASDLPGVRSVVDHESTGLLVPPGSADALASAMRSLIDDPTRAQEMGRRGRHKAEERYSWVRIAERLEDAYRRAIGRVS